MKQLPEKMQEVIQLRFFNPKPPSYKEIGASMGVSRERIRQYEKTAMNLIRMKLTRAEAA
jgi:RNA polymerase sigma factor (sigma-70 family)